MPFAGRERHESWTIEDGRKGSDVRHLCTAEEKPGRAEVNQMLSKTETDFGQVCIEQFIQFGVFSVVLTFFIFEGVDIMGALSTWVATWALARKDALEKAEREAEKERTHRERVERELKLLKAELDGLRMQNEIDRDSRE